MKLRAMKFSGMKYAIPNCEKSSLACRLVGQNYLTPEQVKMFELLGLRIETEKELEPVVVPQVKTKYVRREL